jgi:hypothetical protein
VRWRFVFRMQTTLRAAAVITCHLSEFCVAASSVNASKTHILERKGLNRSCQNTAQGPTLFATDHSFPMTFRSQADAEHETATFTYLEWQVLYEKEKPFEIFIQIPEDAEDKRWTNQFFKQGPRQHIRDLRGNEDSVSLDQNGFEYRKHAFKFTDCDNNDAIAQEYLPEVERFIMDEVEGAERVHIFNWEVFHTVDPLNFCALFPG